MFLRQSHAANKSRPTGKASLQGRRTFCLGGETVEQNGIPPSYICITTTSFRLPKLVRSYIINIPRKRAKYLFLKLDKNKNLVIANPIYQEIIPREITHVIQATMIEQTAWDMQKLLENFVVFYRENSEILVSSLGYQEAGPHLLLMAFLQRVINGGGKIHREYALGRRP